MKITASFVLFLLILTLLIQTTQATEDKGIFQILDETYVDNITDLPYSNGIPDKNIQTSYGSYAKIVGWIDIVGFNKMSKDNGIYYVPGNPVNYTITQNAAWGVFTCAICRYFIEKDIQIVPSGNNTTAILNIEMTWYEKVCGRSGCSCIKHIEYASFNDTEKSPNIVESLIEPEINIIQYNNTLYENVGIQIIPQNIENITKIDVKYNDSSITRTFKTGYVEKTEKGIFFANLTEMPLWDTTGKNISRLDNMIFMNGNLSKINATNIKISTSNLYETKYHTNYTISREEFRPEKETIENPLLMSFWSIILIIFGGAYLTVTKMRII